MGVGIRMAGGYAVHNVGKANEGVVGSAIVPGGARASAARFFKIFQVKQGGP